jgi:hypothetical protein
MTALWHRIAGVGGEIGQARLQLRRIDHHRPDLGAKLQRDLDSFAERAAQ